jgi:hypothetical protein
MAKRRSRKKTFSCGHVGKGQHCHRCEQEDEKRKEAQQRRMVQQQQQQAWRQTFDNDPINLRHLPQRVLVERARAIIAAVKSGVGYHEFDGKKLRQNDAIISIPLNYSYRLIFRRVGKRLEPLECLSHEAYNKQRYM